MVLPDNSVPSILADAVGNIWIGTYGGGLCRRVGDKFSYYAKKDGLPIDDVRALFEDKDGSLWIGTGGGGLVRLSAGRLFSSYGEREGLSVDTALNVMEDRRGDMWVGTFKADSTAGTTGSSRRSRTKTAWLMTKCSRWRKTPKVSFGLGRMTG